MNIRYIKDLGSPVGAFQVVAENEVERTVLTQFIYHMEQGNQLTHQSHTYECNHSAVSSFCFGLKKRPEPVVNFEHNGVYMTESNAEKFFGLYCNQCNVWLRKEDGAILFYPISEIAQADLSEQQGKNPYGKPVSHLWKVTEFGKQEGIDKNSHYELCPAIDHSGYEFKLP